VGEGFAGETLGIGIHAGIFHVIETAAIRYDSLRISHHHRSGRNVGPDDGGSSYQRVLTDADFADKDSIYANIYTIPDVRSTSLGTPTSGADGGSLPHIAV